MEELKDNHLEDNKYPRVILGLDVSTSCIGVCIVKDYGLEKKPEIIAVTHKSPKVPKDIDGIESLFIKDDFFNEGFLQCISEYTNEKITDVIIEEPLLTSNNAYTVATLLRFNGMIAKSVYKELGVVANFISSYDARMYSFPELVALRKYNKKGVEYSLKHVNDAIKKDNIVLFGSYPFDVDKKSVMMNMVNEMFQGEEEIPWELNKKGDLKKQNYDACDALICALAYINVNHYGIEKPTIVNFSKKEDENQITINYTTKIWNKTFDKILVLNKNS